MHRTSVVRLIRTLRPWVDVSCRDKRFLAQIEMKPLDLLSRPLRLLLKGFLTRFPPKFVEPVNNSEGSNKRVKSSERPRLARDSSTANRASCPRTVIRDTESGRAMGSLTTCALAARAMHVDRTAVVLNHVWKTMQPPQL